MSDPVDALLRQPLLGRRRVAALREAGALAAALLQRPDPRAEARLLAWGALQAQAAGARGAALLLLSASGRCSRQGEEALAARCGLAYARALAQGPEAALAPRRARPFLDAAREFPALAGDLALTEALLDPGADARAALERALVALPTPDRDHDRLTVHLALAERLRVGGDASRALPHLEAAWGLVLHYEDGPGIVLVALGLGGLLLGIGQGGAARPVLREGMRWAHGDSLSTLALGSLSMALAIGDADWDEVEGLSLRVEAAARNRQSPLGLVDAWISRATAWLARGEAEAAIHLLATGGAELAEEGHAAALNLVKARLGELRARLGAEAFDPIFATATGGLTDPGVADAAEAGIAAVDGEAGVEAAAVEGLATTE